MLETVLDIKTFDAFLARRAKDGKELPIKATISEKITATIAEVL
jgi:hypothetical protein